MGPLITADRALQEPVDLLGVGRHHRGGSLVVYLEAEDSVIVVVSAESLSGRIVRYEWGPFGLISDGIEVGRLVLPVELPADTLWEIAVDVLERDKVTLEVLAGMRRVITT
jgi:hypothetical protein